MESVLGFFSSPWLAIAIFVIVMAAAVVQAGLGMGFGLTAAPLLALIDAGLVPVPALFLGMVSAGWGAWRERSAIAWNEVGVGLIGRFAGVGIGTFILLNLSDRRAFMLVFGLMVFAAVVLSLAGWRLAFNRVNLIATTIVSGLMATITSVGAPPLALIYQDRPAQEARPTLAAFFCFGCAIALAALYATGWADMDDFLLALFMAPAMLAGIAIARLAGTRFDKRFRPALLAIAGFAAVILIIRGLG